MHHCILQVISFILTWSTSAFFQTPSELIYLADFICVHQQAHKWLTVKWGMPRNLQSSLCVNHRSLFLLQLMKCQSERLLTYWTSVHTSPFTTSTVIMLSSSHIYFKISLSHYINFKIFFFLINSLVYVIAQWSSQNRKKKANKTKQQVLYHFERFQLHKALWHRLYAIFCINSLSHGFQFIIWVIIFQIEFAYLLFPLWVTLPRKPSSHCF